MTQQPNVYIGYDQREHLAAEVCRHSIIRRTAIEPENVHYLKSENIPEFVREREPQQATDFTYTRFMIPFLNNYRGISIFCDCDFIFCEDIWDLVSYFDPSKAISVVQHPPYIPHTATKMDGVPQHAMPRKNWASLIMFNNAHPSNKKLTPEYVNTVMPGRKLHTFDWLQDDEIGSLPLDWNTLDNYYYLEEPRAIHFTDGGPWFEQYRNTTYAPAWWREYYDFASS
jgi:lipopolysaccharide biosynthesis glycosyltransferase